MELLETLHTLFGIPIWDGLGNLLPIMHDYKTIISLKRNKIYFFPARDADMAGRWLR